MGHELVTTIADFIRPIIIRVLLVSFQLLRVFLLLLKLAASVNGDGQVIDLQVHKEGHLFLRGRGAAGVAIVLRNDRVAV